MKPPPPRDPRRAHPGHEPSEPPKRVLGVPIPPRRPAVPPPADVETSAPVVPPATDPRPSTFARGGAWTKDHVTAVISVMSMLASAYAAQRTSTVAQASDVDTSKVTIVAELAAAKREIKAEIAPLTTRITDAEKRLSLLAKRVDFVADVTCKLNDGTPIEGFPCGNIAFLPPKVGHLTPKWRTEARWPMPE